MQPTHSACAAAFSLLAGVLLGTASLAAAQMGGAVPDLDIEVTRLADGIYLFRASSDLDKWTSSNSVAVIGDDGRYPSPELGPTGRKSGKGATRD